MIPVKFKKIIEILCFKWFNHVNLSDRAGYMSVM